MKPTIALAALLICACGGSAADPGGDDSKQPDSPPSGVDGGEWGVRTGLIEPNSELALTELNGKLYLLGGYPSSRQTVRTHQIYDIASDRWEFGPPLPQLNNHGMAASVNGRST